MTTLYVGLAEELQQDFSRARVQLTLARLDRAKKDTPANRAAVAECLVRIDAVLDMYLEAGYLRL